ncbi:Protein of unknown function [Leuconostoc citreum]|nr:Protein of unknown function [Leuconostoc citreum LBAE C10]CCF25686.1 Protein of unknown function [Leuconostoc citreum LBAE C11]CDX64614.1 Protein of unknown function [Leuconostoc citreum]
MKGITDSNIYLLDKTS